MDPTTITAWLLAALTRQMPHNLDAEAIAARESTISDVVTVAFAPEEPPVAIPGFPATRAETALALLGIELHETGLKPRLRRGECMPWECDGGRATGEFQTHIGIGVRLVQSAGFEPCDATLPIREVRPDDKDRCWGRADVLADHVKAARVAMHFLRAGGLPGYTGQPWDGPAPRWIRGFMASAGAPPDRDLPKE